MDIALLAAGEVCVHPKNYQRLGWVVVVVAGLMMPSWSVRAARIKDLVTIQGVRSNMLEGMGLVVGLAGTGDSPRSVANQAIRSYLRKRGLNILQSDLQMRNVAFVTVVANLPPYAAKGAQLDVSVMATGDARSLRGGTLLLTPLLGISGGVYAMAQGSVTVGGFSAAAGTLAEIRRNTPTSGRIPRGALVEKEVRTKFVTGDQVRLALKVADFTTAHRITEAINARLKDRIASTDNPGTVVLKLPDSYADNPVAFISLVETLEVVSDGVAKVVLNERTGTVVVGGTVTIGPAAVAHGNLNVAVATVRRVSQPSPLSRRGRTAVVPNGQVDVSEGRGAMKALPAATTVQDLVRALNALGASSQDLISILQALKAAGSLNGDLEVQ
ncbi:MAG: flagellar basal body P-ring protein FlgI [Myxococcota bacterium]